MFRDQTEANLFVSAKVPVRQGIDAALGGNPAVAEPIGGNRAAEFFGYLDGRVLANRIADRRRRQARDKCDGGDHSTTRPEASRLADEDAEGQSRGEPGAKSKKKHRISLQRVKGVHREAGGETLSVLTAGLGAPAGSDGVEGARRSETAFRSALADNQPVCLPQPSQIIRPA